jgi:dTDP-4-amino-4,6-dideoxygalactose transaminase
MAGARQKQSIADLAILGGAPMFDEKLHVGRPNILDPEAFHARVRQAVDRKWLSNDGPLVQQFEREFARFTDVKHCVAVTNATLGLQLLVRSLGVKGKVLMPSFTFIATPHSVCWEGATPLFCDVDDGTHTLDVGKVREMMSAEVGAILGVHLWGRACDVEGLQAVADEWNVPLLFDSAHALGSSYKGVKLGRFGRAEVFSLHATKGINGIEAGFITTQDDELAAQLRAVRNYGFADREVVSGLGINAKLHEISAAMALSNLPHFERLARHNRRIHAAYRRALGEVAGIGIYEQENASGSDHYAVFRVQEGSAIDRDTLVDVLKAENVLAKRYFWPGCHRAPPYAAQPHAPLLVTEHLAQTVFQLPTGLQLEEGDAEAIGRCVALAMAEGAQLRQALSKARA